MKQLLHLFIRIFVLEKCTFLNCKTTSGHLCTKFVVV